MRAFQNMTTVLMAGCWLTSQRVTVPPVGQQHRWGPMLSVRAAALRTGIVGGVLFFVHASIPNCGSYPFIWSALAGAVAFWIASDGVAPHRFRHGMLAALSAGTIAGLILMVGCTGTILIFAPPMLASLKPPPSVASTPLITVAVELGLAVVALLGVAAAVLGGAAMMLVRRLQPSRPAAVSLLTLIALTVAAVAAPSAVHAQAPVAIPNSPAGTLLKQWLDVFNRADSAGLEAFDT